MDVVPPGGKRDGLSYLWTSMPMTVNKLESTSLAAARDALNEERLATESDHTHSHSTPQPQVAQGRFIAQGGRQWSLKPMFFSLGFTGSIKKVRVQCASTIFETGLESMMIGREVGEEAELYANMSLDIPLSIENESVDSESVLELLENKSARPGETVEMYVTSRKDNVIRTINSRPASSFLEESLAAGLFLEPAPPLNTPFLKRKLAENPKNRSVYAVLDEKTRFKVIAGGGGWGARAGMLVLDPEAKIQEGAKIQFYVTKSAGLDAVSELGVGEDARDRIFFECVEPIQFWDESEGLGDAVDEVALEGIFGAGTENQFFVGSKRFDVHGEFCVASIVE